MTGGTFECDSIVTGKHLGGQFKYGHLLMLVTQGLKGPRKRSPTCESTKILCVHMNALTHV
jgi:hypothetical protein